VKVVLSAAAEDDLRQIGDWIAQDYPSRAVTFVVELERACETLSDSPNRFQLLPRHEPSGIRRRPHGNYLIFYRVRESIVDVLHVLHGARDYEKILFPGKS
jgi:plasmid stabilization system protein ParE